MADYQQLKVYQRAFELAVRMQQFRFHPRKAPKLGRQVKRSAASIAANIAEGFDRSPKEFVAKLRISIGESRELQHHLAFSHRLDAVVVGDVEWALNEVEEVRKMMYGLVRYLNSKS